MKRIIKITDLNGNKKSNPIYLDAVGKICGITYLEIGKSMLIQYANIDNGLRTSVVTKIEDNKITTLNSIYYFEDVEGE